MGQQNSIRQAMLSSSTSTAPRDSRTMGLCRRRPTFASYSPRRSWLLPCGRQGTNCQSFVEAKLVQVEDGFEWTSQLDPVLKRCKRGSARGGGPWRKAPEFYEKAYAPKPGSRALLEGAVPLRDAIWMWREIELSKLLVEDLAVTYDNKLVMLLER